MNEEEDKISQKILTIKEDIETKERTIEQLRNFFNNVNDNFVDKNINNSEAHYKLLVGQFGLRHPCYILISSIFEISNSKSFFLIFSVKFKHTRTNVHEAWVLTA